MGILAIGRRMLLYGAGGALVGGLIGYAAGSKEEPLQRAGNHLYVVINPENKLPYFIDFEKRNVRPTTRSLEDIFGEHHDR